MMWVLALDTSSPGGNVALLRDDEVTIEQAGDPALSHAERLPRALADLLADAGLTPGALDLLAVASGPGAFTGLRVGLATVQGLALAIDRPAVGVSSLGATAWRFFQGDAAATACGVWLDGARGDVFAAAFARPSGGAATWPLRELAAPSVATPLRTLEMWRRSLPAGTPLLLGSGRSGHETALAAGRPVVVAEAPLAVPVGRIGRRLHDAGLAGAPHALAPMYVRRPDAEVERDRRRAAGAPTP